MLDLNQSGLDEDDLYARKKALFADYTAALNTDTPAP